ncbi:FHA domain-containing protein [Microbacterium sp. VKM Ac-2870]|nr:FHA domain-containing protein [Microbacterium sp. VKM Ac-2870]
MNGDAMTTARVLYRPAGGDAAWWVAADDGALAVLSPTVSAMTAAAVWRGLGAGGIGTVLEALTGAFGTSLTAIPPFALAMAEAGGVRVAVRGDIEVTVEGESSDAVSGAGVSTWTERFLPGATRVTVLAGGPPAPAGDVPLQAGVVLADLVQIELTMDVDQAAPARTPSTAVPNAAPVAAPPSTPTATTAMPPLSASSAPAPSDFEEASDAEEPPVAASSSASAISSASVIDSLPPGLFGSPAAPTPEPAAESEPAAEPGEPVLEVPAPDASADTLLPEATASDGAPAAVDEYDLLWGETVARPVSAAASAAVDAEAENEAAPASAESPVAVPMPDDPDDLGNPDDLGDHDGATIAVAEMRALRAERPAFESTDSVPERRPTRGRIRLSTGRVVELERPVIIGRRPKSTRTSGADLPTLVAVDSPDQDISRSHVEIRAEGEHVLVTDLDTTNGTVLLRGGNEPVRLHPNEPTMVVSGDVLDLGDDVTVTFEDLP